MNITSIVTALPAGENTGWSVAGHRINEELKKLAFSQDLNNGNLLKQDFPIDFNVPLLQAIRGVDLLPIVSHVRGSKNIGYSFAEDDLLLCKYGPNALRHWDHIVTGSTWAKEKMIIATEARIPVSVAIQGVDKDIFCPSEFIKPDPDWFTVFSGGKWEFRKSQDCVIAAMKVMMERHKDVRLVASWWNPWPHSVATMGMSKLIQITNGGVEHICQVNGLPLDRVEFIEQTSHNDMAHIMNRCDLGLFLNRYEAGTNLVLMEAMSCGLPVIATTEHGHADVTRGAVHTVSSDRFTVERGGVATGEWYEPNLEQVINNLELLYSVRDIKNSYGEIVRSGIKEYNWAVCAQNLLEACQ